jgi:hypothetical protein
MIILIIDEVLDMHSFSKCVTDLYTESHKYFFNFDNYITDICSNSPIQTKINNHVFTKCA